MFLYFPLGGLQQPYAADLQPDISTIFSRTILTGQPTFITRSRQEAQPHQVDKIFSNVHSQRDCHAVASIPEGVDSLYFIFCTMVTHVVD